MGRESEENQTELTIQSSTQLEYPYNTSEHYTSSYIMCIHLLYVLYIQYRWYYLD